MKTKSFRFFIISMAFVFSGCAVKDVVMSEDKNVDKKDLAYIYSSYLQIVRVDKARVLTASQMVATGWDGAKSVYVPSGKHTFFLKAGHESYDMSFSVDAGKRYEIKYIRKAEPIVIDIDSGSTLQSEAIRTIY